MDDMINFKISYYTLGTQNCASIFMLSLPSFMLLWVSIFSAAHRLSPPLPSTALLAVDHDKAMRAFDLSSSAA